MSASTPNGSYVFVDQHISIYCTTFCSRHLAWESDQYIGLHGQVSVTINGEITGGDVKNGSVRLIDVQGNGQQIQISSELRIIVLPDHKDFTIKCRNPDLGYEAIITYQLCGTYLHIIHTQSYIILLHYHYDVLFQT